MIIGSAKGGVTLPNKNNSTVSLAAAAGPSGSVSGENLKVYIKFDDVDGNPANTAVNITDNDTLGSDADLILGGTGDMVYGVTGTPTNLGNATTFPQTDTNTGRWADFGTSTSQFNFMFSTEGGDAPEWSMCFWAKTSVAQTLGTSFLNCARGQGTKGFELYWATGAALTLMMYNGLSGNPTGRPFNYANFTDFSTDGDWHFYAFTMDGGLASNQYKVRRDAETIQEFSKTAGAFATTGDADHFLQWRTQNPYMYIPPTTSYLEFSLFARVLTSEELETLYQNGDGFQL